MWTELSLKWIEFILIYITVVIILRTIIERVLQLFFWLFSIGRRNKINELLPLDNIELSHEQRMFLIRDLDHWTVELDDVFFRYGDFNSLQKRSMLNELRKKIIENTLVESNINELNEIYVFSKTDKR